MSVPFNSTYSNGTGVLTGDGLDTFVQGGCLAANLRVFTGFSNMTVQTLGTSTAGDGGGGTFYWNATSTATDDGVNVIRPYGLTTGAWLRVPQYASGGTISNATITGSSFATGTVSNTAISGGTIANAAISSGTVSNVTLSNATGTISNATISGGSVSNATISNATYSSNLSVVGTLSMGSSFLRNKLINGGFAVDQRNSGASQTITAGAALAYTVDRWFAYCTGANVTGQRITGSAPNQFVYQITGSSSNTGVGFGQRIETVNSYDLAGTTATLSVSLASSSVTSVTWTVSYANSTDTFGSIASPTVTQIATGTFTVSSTLTSYNTQITVPSAAITGLQVVFTTSALTGTLTFAAAQLEAGSIATQLERRLYGQEFALCQRYYQTFGSNYVFNSQSTTHITVAGLWFVPMRTTPSVSTSSFSSFSADQYSWTALAPQSNSQIYNATAEL